MFSEEMKRFEADMNRDEELVDRFGNTCDRLAGELDEGSCSQFELMARAANELGYQITAEELELSTAGMEKLDQEELAAAAGGVDTHGTDEKGHDAWCLTLWHCHAVTLHTEHKTNRQVTCWSDHMCVINYYSGCYNDLRKDEKPLPKNDKK